MFGDAAGSFVQRRPGRERDVPFPLVGQYGFLAVALRSSLALASAWTGATFTPPVLLVVAVLTPLLHLRTDVVAYLLGPTDEPR
jgi:CDP-2,3-bis-(O-geranylgeranyl)-sn-glycerol synthase